MTKVDVREEHCGDAAHGRSQRQEELLTSRRHHQPFFDLSNEAPGGHSIDQGWCIGRVDNPANA